MEAHYQRWKNERYHDHCHGIENQSKEVKQTCWLEKKELEQRLEEARQKVLELELDNERLREDLVERTMKLKDVSQLR